MGGCDHKKESGDNSVTYTSYRRTLSRYHTGDKITHTPPGKNIRDDFLQSMPEGHTTHTTERDGF